MLTLQNSVVPTILAGKQLSFRLALPALLIMGAASGLPVRSLSRQERPASEQSIKHAVKIEKDRSPIDLALSADGHWALAANATSDTVSLVDVMAGKVIAEVEVGKRPFAAALSKDGKRAIISNQYADSITVLDVTPNGLTIVGTIAVGDEPRGVALNAEGTQAFVALSGEDKLAFVDLMTGKVTFRLPTGMEPWHVALTPDGSHLAVGNARGQSVNVVDVAQRKIDRTVDLHGHNVRHVAISPDSAWAYAPYIAEKGLPVTQTNINEGWVVGRRLSRTPLKEEGMREAIALDPRGRAVGDVDGVAISPDNKTIAATAGGTHELLLYHLPLPFLSTAGPGDHIASEMLDKPDRFRRIPLGGRPLGIAFSSDNRTVVVANYLLNALQVIDTQTDQITRTIPLGGPNTPSLARKGEAIFLDASRSYHQWYSCNTCHVEGHTNGNTFDTFNDGSYDTPKKTLSLRGVTQTGPWTWHGWQKDLRQLARDSMMKSMQGPEPTEADLDALMAYLQTLDFKPNPNANPHGELSLQVKRGEAVFNAKGCDTCHAALNYTTPVAYDVGLEETLDPYKGFNPPSLRGIYNRAPYLHTGGARTLEQLLTRFHKPSRLTGKPDPTPAELTDLIAFLKTL